MEKNLLLMNCPLLFFLSLGVFEMYRRVQNGQRRQHYRTPPLKKMNDTTIKFERDVIKLGLAYLVVCMYEKGNIGLSDPLNYFTVNNKTGRCRFLQRER